MRSALALVLAVACSPDIEHFPILPGGGGIGSGQSGSGSGSGATPDAGTGELEGSVCVLQDPRDFTSCATTDLAGITVALTGDGSAITGSDGTFELPPPTGTDLTWTVTGTNLVPSTMGFGAPLRVFAIDVQTFNDLLNSNGVVADPNQGTILGFIAAGGAGFAGVKVAAAPPGIYDPFYAVPDSTAWLGSATSALGTFLVAGLTPGIETLTLTPAGLGSGSAAGSGSAVGSGSGSAAGSGTMLIVPAGSGQVTFVHAQL